MAHVTKKQLPPDANADLGLGTKVVEENKTRFVNHNGTFNVHRKGIFKYGAFSPYHASLKMSWLQFYAWMVVWYAIVNVAFTALYLFAGHGAFADFGTVSMSSRLSQLFVFSIQVLTPLGKGELVPITLLVKTFITLEAITGVLGFTVIASLIFARFSNPATKIIFSDRAVVGPYKNMTAFMFRIINGRSNELINAATTVTVSFIGADGKPHFHKLPLERESVLVFPLNWTIVHPIDEESPLHGLTKEDFAKARIEFVVNVTAIDEDLSREVYARSSYTYDEIVFGTKFANILERDEKGTIIVDPSRIHELEGPMEKVLS